MTEGQRIATNDPAAGWLRSRRHCAQAARHTGFRADLDSDAQGGRDAYQLSEGVTMTGKAILALDLGTTAGWAVRAADGLITSGAVSFKPGRFDGGGMRYLRFANWLSETEKLAGPFGVIHFEEVRRHAATDAAHVYGGLMATLTLWAETREIPYQGVPVGTIKRHATGKGNAPKQAIVEAMERRGHAPEGDNEADALALLYCVLEGGV